MSTTATLDLRIALTNSSVATSKIIPALRGAGWSFDDNGLSSYLPIGDDNDFSWKREMVQENVLMDILRRKELLRESLGVVMTWNDSGIGGEFLFHIDGTVSFSLSINRKKLGGNRITDVNWYLERILPALLENSISVESFEYQEHV